MSHLSGLPEEHDEPRVVLERTIRLVEDELRGAPVDDVLTRLRAELPDDLEVTAWTDKGIIMGVRHKTDPVEGIANCPLVQLSNCSIIQLFNCSTVQLSTCLGSFALSFTSSLLFFVPDG